MKREWIISIVVSDEVGSKQRKATNYVYVKLSGEKTAAPYHPSDIEVTV